MNGIIKKLIWIGLVLLSHKAGWAITYSDEFNFDSFYFNDNEQGGTYYFAFKSIKVNGIEVHTLRNNKMYRDFIMENFDQGMINGIVNEVTTFRRKNKITNPKYFLKKFNIVKVYKKVRKHNANSAKVNILCDDEFYESFYSFTHEKCMNKKPDAKRYEKSTTICLVKEINIKMDDEIKKKKLQILEDFAFNGKTFDETVKTLGKYIREFSTNDIYINKNTDFKEEIYRYCYENFKYSQYNTHDKKKVDAKAIIDLFLSKEINEKVKESTNERDALLAKNGTFKIPVTLVKSSKSGKNKYEDSFDVSPKMKYKDLIKTAEMKFRLIDGVDYFNKYDKLPEINLKFERITLNEKDINDENLLDKEIGLEIETISFHFKEKDKKEEEEERKQREEERLRKQKEEEEAKKREEEEVNLVFDDYGDEQENEHEGENENEHEDGSEGGDNNEEADDVENIELDENEHGDEQENEHENNINIENQQNNNEHENNDEEINNNEDDVENIELDENEHGDEQENEHEGENENEHENNINIENQQNIENQLNNNENQQNNIIFHNEQGNNNEQINNNKGQGENIIQVGKNGQKIRINVKKIKKLKEKTKKHKIMIPRLDTKGPTGEKDKTKEVKPKSNIGEKDKTKKVKPGIDIKKPKIDGSGGKPSKSDCYGGCCKCCQPR